VRDVDNKFKCIFCDDIVSNLFYLIDFGRAEYVEELDLMCFSQGDPTKSPARVVSHEYASELYYHLLDYDEEVREQADLWGITREEAEYSMFDNLSAGVNSPPATWFLSVEPDTCTCCRRTLNAGDKMTQVSIVKRDGRSFSEPEPRGCSGARYTYFCECCVNQGITDALEMIDDVPYY
jgi:hypothetical protein